MGCTAASKRGELVVPVAVRQHREKLTFVKATECHQPSPLSGNRKCEPREAMVSRRERRNRSGPTAVGTCHVSLVAVEVIELLRAQGGLGLNRGEKPGSEGNDSLRAVGLVSQ